MTPSPFRRLFRIDRGRPELRRDIEQELEYHLARHAERLVAGGMPPSLARQEALRAFGDVGAISREIEHIDRGRWARRRNREVLRGILTDARVAFRSLRRAPGFTITALLTLALGIGATAAVFSVVNAVLLRPLPYPQPERLVQVQELNASGARANWPVANFNEMRERARTLDRVAYYRGGTTTVRGADDPRRAQIYAVSGGFFDVLGVAPAMGSTFVAADYETGSPPAAVVSHRFWRSALGGDPEFDRRMLRIGGEAFPVIGVMPPSFAYPADAEVWVATRDDTPSRTAHNWAGIGRLAAGATPETARAELDGIMRDIKRREGAASDAIGAYVQGLHGELSAGSRKQVLLLQGAVGLVLLLTCVNLTSANLARAEHRHREVAVRAALGAGRGRLVRLLLAESLLLAIGGGALGIALAAALVRVAGANASTGLPGFARLSLDLRVLGFAAAVTIVSGVGIGLLPALGAARVDLRRVIGDGGRTTGAGRLRARSVLVALEFALAFAVLIPAGLLLRSMGALLDVDPGFRAERVVTATISLPSDAYPDTTAIALFHSRVLSRLAAIPGVESVALASSTPMGPRDLSTDFEVEGKEPAGRRAGYRVVSPGYLSTMGIPLVRGRNIEATDVAGVPHVVLINEAAARLYWPDGDALGRRIRFPGMDNHVDDWMTVVGIVGDVRFDALDAAPRPEMFVSHQQRPERADVATLLVRAAGEPDVLSTAIRGVLRSEAPAVPVELRSMQAVVDQTLGARRFMTTIISAFGVLSLILAAVGVYGVLAYSVAQRRRELAVRLALGAQPGELRRMVLRDGLGAALPGLIGGVLAALALTRLIRSMVVGVSPGDPATYAAVGLLLLTAALLASFIPAHRATRVDPLAALRAD